MPAFIERPEEEELAVLPRHTKVIVTGNNRTRPVLVGLQGVVKKAVGLGGWYWLVLTNGDEVKLQRNALSVIEAPTGEEDEYGDISLSSSDSGLANASRQKLTVNLRRLGMMSLWRYCRHFKLTMMDFQPSREKLIEAVERHFVSQKQLDEFQVIADFLQSAKHLKQSAQGVPSRKKLH